MQRRIVYALAMLFCAPFAPAFVRGDVFHLRTGGKVEGEWLNDDEPQSQTYRVKTKQGVEIELDRKLVSKVKRTTPREREYARRNEECPDTVAGHLELAEWCRKNFMETERRRHLERVIAIDPDNEDARRRLKHIRHDGVWTTEEQLKTSQGYVRYKGGWVTPQERELRERKSADKKAVSEWYGKLKTLRAALDKKKAAEAIDKIRSINDVAAIDALADAIKKEPLSGRRKLFAQALMNIGRASSYQIVAERALADDVEDVRLTCLELLQDVKSPDVVAFFIENLESPINITVNRAAVGLKYMADPAAIAPLVEALVTTHKYKFQQGGPGQMSTTFGNNGVNGFSTGPKTTVVTEHVENTDVLVALESLTTVSFDYDEPAWREWLAAQKQNEGPADRRDDGA